MTPDHDAISNLNSLGVPYLLIPICAFTVLVQVAPLQLSSWMAFAWSLMTEWNVGDESFELQGVMYLLFHRNFFAQMTHLTIISDTAAWIVLFQIYFGHIYLFQNVFSIYHLLILLHVVQSFTFRPMRESAFAGVSTSSSLSSSSSSSEPAVFLDPVAAANAYNDTEKQIRIFIQPSRYRVLPALILWIPIYVVTSILGHHHGGESIFGMNVSTICEVIIVAGSILRVIGHAVDEVGPPVIFDRDKPQYKFLHGHGTCFTVFVKYAKQSPAILLWGPIFALISEIQSGMPHRLCNILLYMIMQRFYPFYESAQMKKMKAIADRIYIKGWSSWETTASMFKIKYLGPRE